MGEEWEGLGREDGEKAGEEGDEEEEMGRKEGEEKARYRGDKIRR